MRAPVLVLGVAIAFNSMATDFVSPESPNDFGKPNSVLDDKLSWYQSHWQKIKDDYYACQNDIDRRIIRKLGIHNVKEELAELERLQILVDGANDKYMLQIFMREASVLYDESRAGPFFYEIIQRAGDQGFGYGNFRALFESIERAQSEGTP